MEVEYLILARYAEYVAGSGLNVLGGVVERVRAEAFPHNLPSLFIAARVALTPEEARIPHVLRIRVIGPDNEQIMETDELRPEPREVPPPSQYGHIQITLGFLGLVILQEGLVRVQLLYDGEQAKEARLQLVGNVPSGEPGMPLQVIPEGDAD